MAARFSCKLSAQSTPLPHVWEHSVGSDHAPIALRADWQAQLRRSHDELGFRYVRFHGLLSDDMGTLVRHRGRSLYSFFNADQIFDFLLSIGMKPFVELSFMPLALASGNQTVFHYRGNVTPPEDYEQWSALIKRFACHLIERYGIKEVSQWLFEVWNEPNLKQFWSGEQADYFKLYSHTARTLKAVSESLSVGGPATATNGWIADFLEFCAAHDLPADFVSTHHYPDDGFGNAGDDTETQLSLSRRGVLREQAAETRGQAGRKPVYYTEWNTSSNPRDPLHDEPYAAAFVIKTIMEASRLVDGYSFWTFSDIFEEMYFPSLPFHGGFGLLNLHGIAKPSYRAFELLHRLGAEQLHLSGTHETVDAWAVRRERDVTILLANHALPRHPIGLERVHVTLTDAAVPRSVVVERIDHDHANAKRLWDQMGAPEYLSAAAAADLHDASRLQREPQTYTYEHDTMALDIALPPQAVAAITIEFIRLPATG
ncbi:MAG: beta-xylosidase [Burkholderiales bacterium]|nr:beta-xylosidase [Burkholderiales bacterium]